MKTIAALLMLALTTLSSTPAEARRAPKKAPNVLFLDQVAAAFVIPAVGSTAGVAGTFWKSEVTISNFRSAPQRIAVRFLQEGVDSSGRQAFIFELPSYEANGDLGLVAEDFLVERLGLAGLGALVVEAIDSSGAPDPNGQIDGFARVWTSQPPSAGCSNPIGTVSQTMLAVPTGHLMGSAFSAFAVGLRHDESFRTNVGIVNLSSAPRTWRVDLFGNRGDISFNMTVPGNSMDQMPLPTGTYGNLVVTFTLIGSGTADVRWTAYGVSVDNRTGDGWLRHASY